MQIRAKNNEIKYRMILLFSIFFVELFKNEKILTVSVEILLDSVFRHKFQRRSLNNKFGDETMEMESRMKSVMKEDSERDGGKNISSKLIRLGKHVSCTYSSEIFYKILSSSLPSLSIHFMLCF